MNVKLGYISCLSVSVLSLHVIPNIVSPFQILPSASISTNLLVANYFVWRFDFSFCPDSNVWQFPRGCLIAQPLEISFSTLDLNLFISLASDRLWPKHLQIFCALLFWPKLLALSTQSSNCEVG